MALSIRFGAVRHTYEQQRRPRQMPEYVMFIVGDMEKQAKFSQHEAEASTAEVIAWFEKHTRSGEFVEGAGRRLQGPETAVTVNAGIDNTLAVDGPYAETKEVVGGYAVIDAPDLQTAIDLVKTWPGLPAKIELRPVFVM
jgi:hypothetical protein